MTIPILRTKLNRPPVAEDHLHRKHLLDRLDRRLHRPLTLVSAPAGYGKSTLVSCWVEACQLPCAWVSLDENDNDMHFSLPISLRRFNPSSRISEVKPESIYKLPIYLLWQCWPAL